jgi:hypothetical protein
MRPAGCRRADPGTGREGENIMIGWLAGLSLATKLGIGATAAAVGVAGGGAAGVLPAPAQEVFDAAVVAVEVPQETTLPLPPAEDGTGDPVQTPTDGDAPAEQPAEQPAEDTPAETPAETPTGDLVQQPEQPADTEADDKVTHGDRVSAVARDKTLSGREHGKAVSAAAHDKAGKQPKVRKDADEDAPDAVDGDAADPKFDVKPAKKDKPTHRGKGND